MLCVTSMDCLEIGYYTLTWGEELTTRKSFMWLSFHIAYENDEWPYKWHHPPGCMMPFCKLVQFWMHINFSFCSGKWHKNETHDRSSSHWRWLRSCQLYFKGRRVPFLLIICQGFFPSFYLKKSRNLKYFLTISLLEK